MITVVIGIVFIVVIYIELKYIRGRKVGRSFSENRLKKDQAFNSLHTTKAVRNKLKIDRMDTIKADYMIQKAQDAYDSSEYEGCLSACAKARDELLKSKREGAVLPVEEKNLPEEKSSIAQQAAATRRLKEDTVGKDNLYLQAKFELNAAKGDLDAHSGDSEEREKASQLIAQADSLFESKQYQKSLSQSFKARKILSGELQEEAATRTQSAAVERIPPIQPEMPAESAPAEEEPVEDVTTLECKECGTPHDDVDLYCGSCGSNLKERKCSGCGSKMKEKDSFCRKCGKKV